MQYHSTNFPCFHGSQLICSFTAEYPRCDIPPKPPSRLSPGTAVFHYGIGISSICPGAGSLCSSLAWQIAWTVVPQLFAISQSRSPSALRRISDGRSRAGSLISPASIPQSIHCPRSPSVTMKRPISPFIWTVPAPDTAETAPSANTSSIVTVSSAPSMDQGCSQCFAADCKAPSASS